MVLGKSHATHDGSQETTVSSFPSVVEGGLPDMREENTRGPQVLPHHTLHSLRFPLGIGHHTNVLPKSHHFGATGTPMVSHYRLLCCQCAIGSNVR